MADAIILDSEEWRRVPGFDFYEVSSHGRLRSLQRAAWQPHPRNPVEYKMCVVRPAKLLRGKIHMVKGRPNRITVTMRRDGETIATGLHRVVLEAFIGPCPPGMEGCHYDGNPLNNRLDNLRWDTRKANSADAKRHNRRVLAPVYYGSSHAEAKLTPEIVAEIRATPMTRGAKTMLAKKFGVSRKTILNVVTRKAWRHGSGIVERRPCS